MVSTGKITKTDVYYLHLLSLNDPTLPEAQVTSGILQCCVGADQFRLISLMDVSLYE